MAVAQVFQECRTVNKMAAEEEDNKALVEAPVQPNFASLNTGCKDRAMDLNMDRKELEMGTVAEVLEDHKSSVHIEQVM